MYFVIYLKQKVEKVEKKEEEDLSLEDTESGCSLLDETELMPLPTKPRFSTMMSPEAAYTTLMCYDDIIEHKLRRVHPGVVKRKSEKHVITPSKVRCTCESDEGLVEPGSARQLHTLTGGSGQLPPPELRLTRRLNTAMDLVDSLKHKQGQLPLSQSFTETVRDPVRQYHAWSNAWSTDFSIEQ